MQITASTLLASQQVSQVQAKPVPGFRAALDKSEAVSTLPLRQTTPTDERPAAMPVPPGAARPGGVIDLKV